MGLQQRGLFQRKDAAEDPSLRRLFQRKDMLRRCYSEKCAAFSKYGGRGIGVCERWRVFQMFFEDMGKRHSGTSLDRIDNDGNYCPENCRWTTRRVQQRNQSRSIFIEINGCTKNLWDWCEEYGRSGEMVYKRIRKGFDPVKALTLPPLSKAECGRLGAAKTNSTTSLPVDQPAAPQ